jgi:site-specific DNA-methyltransferase (adenine-specific)
MDTHQTGSRWYYTDSSEKIKIYLGNCLDIMTEIPDQSVDMILCDLPYGTTKCKWDVIISFEPLWEQYKRILKSNGVSVLFGSEPFSSFLRLSNLKQYKYDWVWDKVTARGHLVAKKRPMQQTEYISVFGGTVYYPQMIKRPPDKVEVRKKTEYARTEIMGGKTVNAPVNKVYDEWYPKNIITCSNAGSSVKSFHPTQKPVELLEYLIKTYTLENEVVLDNCMGSGSTGIAAINLNRKFIGIELDENYYNIAKERIIQANTFNELN